MTRTTGGNVRHLATRDLWEARYVGADGRRHSIYAKTRREAQERLRVALQAADHGIRPFGQQLSVAAFLDDWLATSVRQRCRPRTVDSYAETVRRYIEPAIGPRPLAKLEPEHVGRMLAELTARQTLSPTTVRYAYVVLRIALGRALKEGKVLRNVATLVDPPARATHELRPLAAAQARAFLATVVDDRLGALFLAAIGTGLRQGELLGLQWSDIDLEAGRLTVRHTLQRGARVLAEPKTERARRTLTLPVGVLAGLREQRRRQLAERLAAGARWHDGNYVFAAGNGRPLQSRNVGRAFHAPLDRAGLPRQPFHALRHACATLLLEEGEELSVVSRILGHANLSTTADVYAHFTRGQSDRAAARMDGILSVAGEA